MKKIHYYCELFTSLLNAAVLADHVLEVEVALAGVELPLVHELHRGHLGCLRGCLLENSRLEGGVGVIFLTCRST